MAMLSIRDSKQYIAWIAEYIKAFLNPAKFMPGLLENVTSQVEMKG